MFNTATGRLRIISLVEALSYLILLFIAMPMKYLWEEPLAVRIVGSLHGFLFCVFCVALLDAMLTQKWNIKPPALIFLASLIPFAPLWVERWLKTQQAEQPSWLETLWHKVKPPQETQGKES
ncbi:DUF3817 domain-containing protein [Verrucomicrobiaceae bacterium N1E253]|uniref:DUF3817 domain-containing protein n=1 Tax=Oceaniferula marina TaxID=2748318 RepID=A0A851GG76_9BACT|nr:DUF3817 domain-containing protein [Oceaniferula marina]NWK56366.1 DUF3817 domain-containing protein [Oceaniferula marina]